MKWNMLFMYKRWLIGINHWREEKTQKKLYCSNYYRKLKGMKVLLQVLYLRTRHKYIQYTIGIVFLIYLIILKEKEKLAKICCRLLTWKWNTKNKYIFYDLKAQNYSLLRFTVRLVKNMSNHNIIGWFYG